VIDTITPHYVAGYASVETLGEIFASPSRRASSNYGIGNDGRIALYVDERNRSWCSSSAANDNRAITIECANYMDNENGHVYGQLPDATWESLVSLCADICQRNGKTRLVYRAKSSFGNIDYSGLQTTDMLLTKHKWFASTDCPGPWLDGQFDRLAQEVNARLGGTATRVKVSIADVAARIHYDMVTDERNGYSQYPDRWGGDNGAPKTLEINGRKYTYKPGSFDCSSSTILAYQLSLQGTPYEGALDDATCTSDMRSVFVGSGLFTASYTPAKRGDLYLAEGKHVAMCQDGGSDGVFGYDCLTEFNRNEYLSATGGKPGDQDGQEAIIRNYYDDGWNTVLHYNGKADYYIENDNKQSDGQSEDEMVCLIQPDGKNYIAYFDGSKLYALGHEDEANAIREVYKKTHNGAKIPEFAFGSEKAPWSKRLLDAVSRPMTKI
jgi:hypothetical protein